MDEYARPRKKPRTLEEDGRNLKLHILPALGHIKVRELSRADISRFHASRAHARVNANRCLALISHIMSVAEKWGVREFGTNPCRGIDRYREQMRERFLLEDELLRLGKALDEADPLDQPGSTFTDLQANGQWRQPLHRGLDTRSPPDGHHTALRTSVDGTYP